MQYEPQNKNSRRLPHITRYEIVHGECTALAFIVGEQDDTNVLDRDNQSKGQIMSERAPSRSSCDGLDVNILE
jgi:hypothetical protein